MPRVSTIAGLLVAAVIPLHNHAAFAATSGTANGTIQVENSTGFTPCDALIQAGLGNRVLTALDQKYEPRIKSYYSLNSQLRPWCLVQPQSTEEVSKTMKALMEAGDGAGDWHIAVRAGGHSLGRSNTIDLGVTIDLGHLNQSTYNKETNTASIGPGGKWKNVYADLHKQGVVATGGRDGDVGVGGFLLGGGLTYYIGTEGFGTDSVVNYEVVLTNGTIVNANKDQNADLWLALRGGGPQFGIVTRFDMSALPDTQLAYGTRVMSANYSSEITDALVHFTDSYHEHPTDATFVLLAHDTELYGQADIVAVAIHVNTEGVHNSTGFEKLRQIPAIAPDETVSISLAEAAEGSQLPGGTWSAGATLSFKNDKRIMARAIDLNARHTQAMITKLGADKVQVVSVFQPLPKLLGENSKRKGGNMLGVDLQEHNAIMWTVGVGVRTDQAALAVAHASMNAIVQELKSYAASLDCSNPLVFMNYADFSQDPIGSYGKKNVEHIRRIAEKYDPMGLFQTRVPGGFKISRIDV